MGDGKQALRLTILADEFSVHRLPPTTAVPDAVIASDPFWIGKTADELSLVEGHGASYRSGTKLWTPRGPCGWVGRCSSGSPSPAAPPSHLRNGAAW